MSSIGIRVHIIGKVQGVWFRESTRLEAERIGVTGWVANLPDGSVLAEFHGPTDRVEQMADWCRRGPELARVDRVDITPQTTTAPPPTRFEVRR